jgi:hypothetical protein
MRPSLVFLILALAACGPRLKAEPGPPIALADSDLVVAGVAYGADSSEVRRVLGPPSVIDSTSWRYEGLRIWFEGSKVHQMALMTRRLTTSRGLRVGDDVDRLTGLYGPSCTEGVYNYCRTVGDDPDERGILVQVENGVVTDIRLGAVFDLD